MCACVCMCMRVYVYICVYVTGPAKMDQVGTQILTTFFTFVAS